MIIFPAIDLKGGRCVRLRQGRADEETVFSDDPVRMAQSWEAQGAAWLHVVDLDGAFAGRPAHTELIRRLIAAVRIPVQVGGGLRTDADLDGLFRAGAARAVLGTRAWSDPEGLARLLERHGERLAVGLDARGGRLTVRGWTETTGSDVLDLAARLDRLGARTLIYTDVAGDGMLRGPNLAATAALCERVAGAVIASGGVASAADVAALAALAKPNLAGVIVGRALYERAATLADLRRAAGACP